MPFVGHVLVIMVIAGGILVAAGGLAFLGARRYVRRRWHRLRTHVATRGVLASLSLLGGWREGMSVRRTPEELSRGTASRARRNMWTAIEDAEAAVQHADSVGAPVAELPSVCRTLRSVGGELDLLVRLGRRLPLDRGRPDAVRAQVAEVIRAAHDVGLAALGAVSQAQEPRLRAMERDAHDEVEILAAGLSRLRSVTFQQHP